MNCALILAALLASTAQAAREPYGILLLAHGGDASWNGEIAKLRAAVDKKVPTETALGMADIESLQAAVNRLEKRGVARVVAVPLFVQTRSEVLDQTRYALGLADKPSAALKAAYERMASAHAGHAGHGAPAAHHGHSMEFSTKQVKARGPIMMTPALDDSPLVADILVKRAKALSKNAARETVILVAHGPVDEDAMAAWQASLADLAASVKTKGGFRQAIPAMLRDDAEPKIRAAAVQHLRQLVLGASTDGGAIVVPVLIARGGIEKKIVKDLAGLKYAWDGKTLMPNAGFDAWVLERARALGSRPIGRQL